MKLKKNQDFYSEEFFKKRIEKIPVLKYKAFFSILFATGARVGEVIGSEKNKEVEGLTVKDITEETTPKEHEKFFDREKFLAIKFETQKRGDKLLRKVPIFEKWCEKIIKKHVKEVERKQTWFLFDFSNRMARLKSQEYFQTNPHSFRHSRITLWLKPPFRFSIKLIKRLTGHKKTDSVEVYTHLNARDVFSQSLFEMKNVQKKREWY